MENNDLRERALKILKEAKNRIYSSYVEEELEKIISEYEAIGELSARDQKILSTLHGALGDEGFKPRSYEELVVEEMLDSNPYPYESYVPGERSGALAKAIEEIENDDEGDGKKEEKSNKNDDIDR